MKTTDSRLVWDSTYPLTLYIVDEILYGETGKNYRLAFELIPVKDIYRTNLPSSRLILQKPLRNLLGNHRCVPPSTIVNENVHSYSPIDSYPQQF